MIAYKPTVLLIDGHNFFIRNYVVNPTMGVDGDPRGGVVGTLQGIRRLIETMKPTAAFVMWDGDGSAERRRSIRSEYKEGRKVRLNREYDFDTSAGTELRNLDEQVQMTMKHLTLLGVGQVRCPGVEADDLLAYAAGALEGCRVVIVTTDRDLLQLVNGDIEVYNPVKKKVVRPADVLTELGCLPSNYACMKAVCGDKGDGVDGVEGVGPKTLLKLVPELATEESMGLPRVLDLIASRTVDAKGKPVKKAVEITAARDYVEENMTLVSLATPMVSAEAARSCRAVLDDAREFRPLNLRSELVVDGIQLSNDFDKQFMMLAGRTALWSGARKKNRSEQ